MTDPTRTVSWHVEGWHIRMDDTASDFVASDIHDQYVLENVLEKVERPLMGMRGWVFKVRMAGYVNG